jgi:alpha-L-arabinofuranosidase
MPSYKKISGLKTFSLAKFCLLALLTINGARLATSGHLYRMAPDSVDATVSVDKKPEVQVEEQTLGALPETITVRPFSVNIYSYPVQ